MSATVETVCCQQDEANDGAPVGILAGGRLAAPQDLLYHPSHSEEAGKLLCNSFDSLPKERNRATVDQQAVAKQWQARGFSCDLWVDPPGQVWEDYRHTTDELVMPVEGRLELEFGGRCFRPEPGEEILIPAGMSHTVRNIGGTSAKWLYGYSR